MPSNIVFLRPQMFSRADAVMCFENGGRRSAFGGCHFQRVRTRLRDVVHVLTDTTHLHMQERSVGPACQGTLLTLQNLRGRDFQRNLRCFSLGLFVPHNGQIGAQFLTPRSPRKSLCLPLFRAFSCPGHEAHELSQRLRGAHVRKIFCPQFRGRNWLHQFYGRLGFLVLSAGENLHTRTIPRFRRGGVWVFLGGGVPNLFFMGTGIALTNGGFGRGATSSC